MPDLSYIKGSLGRRIKEGREQNGLSQDEFGIKMNRGGRHWTWAIESGKIGVNAEDLVHMSRILRRPTSWLLGEGSENVSEEEELVSGFRALPEDGRRWLLGSLRGMLGQVGPQGAAQRGASQPEHREEGPT